MPARDIVRLRAEDGNFHEFAGEQVDAIQEMLQSVGEAIQKVEANAKTGSQPADVSLAAIVMSNGDTYVMPVCKYIDQRFDGKLPLGTLDNPPKLLPGGVTIQRLQVNPKLCMVWMGGYPFYYQC